MKIAIVSLGCPKNQVDADRFCHDLICVGHETVPELNQADAIIINTCGFIESAKEEAIEHIFDACALKKQNPKLVVIAAGCLAQRYSSQLATEIPELNAVVGIGCNGRLPQILQQLLDGEAKETMIFMADNKLLPLSGKRVISTSRHYAWLKIADGCSNACSYCAIPKIRGPLRSRPINEVLDEANWLAEQGVKELVLVAQDVTAYGDDFENNQIIELLNALNQIDGISWIRILYAYPERITKQFLQAMNKNSKVLPYLDLPIQHCNDKILNSMGRKGGRAAILNAIKLIREHLPNAVLRTSLIAGFPGETEQQFQQLCEFVTETAFDRLGCFVFSPEEGTLAEKLPNQLPHQVRKERADKIMHLQAEIMAKKQEALLGSKVKVICDSYDEDEDFWLCRGMADAPEIDVNIILSGQEDLQVGHFYNVCIKKLYGCDLFAELLPKGGNCEFT